MAFDAAPKPEWSLVVTVEEIGGEVKIGEPVLESALWENLEKIISSYPDIKESAAVAVKEERGKYAEDEVMIVIVAEKGKKVDPIKLMKFLEPRMPYFMIPRFVRFEKSLPKTGTQRVQKNKLREKGVTKYTWDREKAGYKIKR